MKKLLILLITSFIGSGLIGQVVGTDRFLFEAGAGGSAGVRTATELQTFMAIAIPSAGIVKSNGTVLQTATVWTDYAGSTTALATGVLKNTTTTGVHTIATAGTDYSLGTSALATGIVKSTTTTGALTIAIAADFPTLNQNTTGTAAGLSVVLVPASGGLGAASLTGYLYGNGASAATASATIPFANTTGGTLAAVTALGATTAVATTFSGGLTSSSTTTISGAATLSGATTTISSANTTLSGTTTNVTGALTFSTAASLVYTPSTVITATGNLAATDLVREVNSATAIVLTIPSGFAIGTVQYHPLLQTCTGQITITASGSETINNGSAAGSYIILANSHGTTIRMIKTTSTNWSIGVGW